MSNTIEYDYDFSINKDGKEINIRVKEIDLDLFKAVRPLLKDDKTEEALNMLKNAVVAEDRDIYVQLLEERDLKMMLALENGFAQILGSYSIEVKKK